jgi:hypothetical protein
LSGNLEWILSCGALLLAALGTAPLRLRLRLRLGLNLRLRMRPRLRLRNIPRP